VDPELSFRVIPSLTEVLCSAARSSLKPFLESKLKTTLTSLFRLLSSVCCCSVRFGGGPSVLQPIKDMVVANFRVCSSGEHLMLTTLVTVSVQATVFNMLPRKRVDSDKL
jgi:hypothetical protein